MAEGRRKAAESVVLIESLDRELPGVADLPLA
eukprot:CAMPEP_0174900758 /NCGR_PEP_ID=MMETSP0167-20121228/32525_1 /TAXON_ID=38298 /ORGANISM="Rhodella maculata, Strain CCMP736" /LENGTH=31 /DNA_ID= /DNA_START= /DNA_END= /DNA_ORIENTATION=